jgi:predicted dehydrogenase
MGISIGLVGLGSFGSAFADLFKRHPLVDRVGLCDREPELVRKFAEREDWADKFHPRDAFDSLDAICRSDFDALAIITQPWLHAPQCIQAMEAGKHVYSAVPVIDVPNGDEILEWCDRLVNTCNRTGMHYMMGETTCFHPGAMYCRRRAAEGAFGDFVYAEGDYLHDVDSPTSSLRKVAERRLASRAGQEWLQKKRQYPHGIVGVPMHYATHSISGPIWVMNARAVKVCCWGYDTRTGDPAYGSPSNETALFYMSNGATMRICEYREIGAPGRETFRIYGTRGSFEGDKWLDKAGKTPLTLTEMRDPLPMEVIQAWGGTDRETFNYGGHRGSHAYLVQEFVDAIATGRRPAIHAWQAVRYTAAGVAAHKSGLKDGELTTVPDWGDPPV